MGLGFIQTVATKVFLKKYLKAVPFDLRDNKKLGFSSYLAIRAIQHIFSEGRPFDKIFTIRGDARETTEELLSRLTGYSLHHLKECIQKTENVLDKNEELSMYFIEVALELPHVSDVFETKGKLNDLYIKFESIC